MNAPWLDAQLADLAARRGHAWLLHGPSGLGQYPLALALATTWLCESPRNGLACGECASCHAVEVHTHADLFALMPETVMLDLGWPLSEKAQQEIDEKKRKPSKEIRIDAMRDAIEFSQRTSARGHGKVVLVYPAERMNTITANALLKTLEEPPGDGRFVLATEAGDQLLPTVRSRCQSHTMAWPRHDQALAWLQANEVAPADAEVLLRGAGGRPEDALAMARAGLDARSWSSLPKALHRGDGGLLVNWAPAQWVDSLLKVAHDLMAVRAGGEPRFFAAADLPAPPSFHVLTRWSRELSRTARNVEHPFKADLMLEALVSRARSALHSTA